MWKFACVQHASDIFTNKFCYIFFFVVGGGNLDFRKEIVPIVVVRFSAILLLFYLFCFFSFYVVEVELVEQKKEEKEEETKIVTLVKILNKCLSKCLFLCLKFYYIKLCFKS